MSTRLAVVTNDYPPRPGGIQQYLANLVGHHDGDVLVLAPADAAATEHVLDAPAGELPPDIAGPDTFQRTVLRGAATFMWPTHAVTDWVTTEVRAFDPDAVLFGAPHPLAAMGSRLRDRLGVPIGVLSHGAEITLPAAVPGLRTALRRTLAAADVRFAVSHYTATRVAALTGADATWIGAGVDVTTFRPRPAAGIGTEVTAKDGIGRPLVIGCISRFVPRKGQDRVLAAAARLRDEGVEVEVLMVGKGRTEASLRRRAAELAVPTRFVVDAPWAELPRLYSEMDVFCMPCTSRWGGLEIEGLGLVFLEAAAVGLPVLAGDSGGSPETVVPGETGYVVTTVDDIVQAVEMLASDPVARLRMGARGRARIEADFTWSRVDDRLNTGFQAVL